MVDGLDDLLGGESLLGGGRGATEAKQTSQGSYLESGLGVEEEMTEQTAGKVVATALLEEPKGSQKDAALRDRQRGFGAAAALHPTGKGQRHRRHPQPSLP